MSRWAGLSFTAQAIRSSFANHFALRPRLALRRFGFMRSGMRMVSVAEPLPNASVRESCEKNGHTPDTPVRLTRSGRPSKTILAAAHPCCGSSAPVIARRALSAAARLSAASSAGSYGLIL